jgi:hypothetical protein
MAGGMAKWRGGGVAAGGVAAEAGGICASSLKASAMALFTVWRRKASMAWHRISGENNQWQSRKKSIAKNKISRKRQHRK